MTRSSVVATQYAKALTNKSPWFPLPEETIAAAIRESKPRSKKYVKKYVQSIGQKSGNKIAKCLMQDLEKCVE